MQTITLNNGIQMPGLIQGLPLLEAGAGMSFNDFSRIVHISIDSGIHGFDTSSAYGPSEEAIGRLMPTINRESVFITTKISNPQMIEGHIEDYVDRALKLMKTDYVDCMLFHWPYPGYVSNWRKLEKAYRAGKVRSIGIANIQARHIFRMKQEDVEILPHIIQTEIHPFRTEDSFVALCKENNIALQACSSLMAMYPKISTNELLNSLALKYNRSLPQIVLRWHIQRGIAPIFRAFKEKHLQESADVYSFQISEEDIERISSLNQNYRLHPESMNCPGY